MLKIVNSNGPFGAIYAFRGERITCENGHPIGKFVRTIRNGELLTTQHVQFEQSQSGALDGCANCGAAWCKSVAIILHFEEDGWRHEP